MQQRIVQRLPSHIPSIAARVAAATLGGYALSHTLSITLVALWPLARAEAVLVAAQLSFLVYAAAVICVFAVRSAQVAWMGLCLLVALSGGLAWWWL